MRASKGLRGFMAVIALVFSIIISTGSLALGFAKAGFIVFARWILIFGAAWLFTQWRNWGWFSSLGLFFVILASAFGLWFEFTPGWLFAGAIFALFAWDISDFRNRMRIIARGENTQGMERRHIARISLLSLIGLFFASIVMFVRGQFNIEWGALLVVITLLGIGQLASWLIG